MRYDLSNFYEKLKEKFNKSQARETLIYLLEEFSKTISLKDEGAIIFVGNELSSFLRVKGQTDLAYKIYKILVDLVIKNYGKKSKEYASLLLNIGNCDIVAKNYDKAIKRLDECEEILKNFDDIGYLLASLYNNRSQAYRAKSILDKAEADIEKALDLIDKKERIAVSRINLAEILILKKEYNKALTNAKLAIDYYEKNNLKVPHLANAYATCANIFYKLGEYDIAIKYYKKAIEVFDQTVGEGPAKKVIERNLEEAKRKRDIL